MRKLIVFLWVFLLSTTSILAQSSDENQEVYDQLKQWAVVKLTIAYMEDLYLFTPDKKGDIGSDEEYKTYKKLHSDYTLFKENINLDSISALLIEGEWTSANRIEFSEYKKELLHSGYKNFKKINYIPSATRDSIPIEMLNRDKALVQINQRFDLLTQQNNEATIVEDDDSSVKELINNETPIQTTPTITKNNTPPSLFLKIFIGFLLVTSSFFYFVYFKKNIKLKEDKIRIQNNSKGTSNGEITTLKQQLRRKEQELISKNNEIDNLKGEINQLEKAHSISKNYSSNPSSSEKIPEIISETTDLEVSNQHSTEIIYLSSPFQNLTFANEEASKEKNSDSLYLVEFDKQMQMGELSVIMDVDFSRALNSPDSYLEGACTYDNVYFNNAKAVQVTEKGEIKLDGNDWNVTKKVRIKFI